MTTLSTLCVPLSRATAIELVAAARQVPVSDLEDLDEQVLDDWLQDETVAQLTRQLIESFLESQSR